MKEDNNSLVKFMLENGISELEHEEKGKKLGIKIRAMQTIKEKIGKIEARKEEQAKPEIKEKIQENYILKSQHVGYFYISGKTADEKIVEVSEPAGGYSKEAETAGPFAKEGSKVHLEGILGIIECMKVPYEIRLADYNDFKGDYGIIEKILAEHEQPVEYGQPLFEIKPVKEAA